MTAKDKLGLVANPEPAMCAVKKGIIVFGIV